MNHIRLNKWIGWIVAGVISAGLVLAVPGITVSASGLTQTNQPPEEGEAANFSRKDVLEKAYQRQLRLMEHVQRDLDRIPNIVDRSEGWIERLQERGIETEGLEEALALFVSQVNQAQPGFDEAAAILVDHKGFDSDGKVVDPLAAAKTLEAAGEPLRTAHQTFHEAIHTFRDTVRALVKEHIPLKEARSGSQP